MRVSFAKGYFADRMKVCRHYCGQQKPPGGFPDNRSSGDGLSSWCRLCHNEASARSRAKRAEREAPIIEAERKAAHAELMARWKADMARNKQTMAENRRQARDQEPAEGRPDGLTLASSTSRATLSIFRDHRDWIWAFRADARR